MHRITIRRASSIVSLTLASALAARPAIAQGSTASERAERAAVQTVVETYLHGLKFNDVPSFEAAFWPDARLFFVKRDGSLGQLTQAEWYKSFVANAGHEEAGDLRVAAVEVTGDAASAKVVETYPTSVYTDYLNLLRLDGRWRIVNKIYTSRKR